MMNKILVMVDMKNKILVVMEIVFLCSVFNNELESNLFLCAFMLLVIYITFPTLCWLIWLRYKYCCRI